jgi:hypothetical protein
MIVDKGGCIMTGSKSTGSDRQEAEAAVEQEAGPAKAEKAARPSGAPETDDSPKRQGDKLEQARDAAAGKLRR